MISVLESRQVFVVGYLSSCNISCQTIPRTRVSGSKPSSSSLVVNHRRHSFFIHSSSTLHDPIFLFISSDLQKLHHRINRWRMLLRQRLEDVFCCNSWTMLSLIVVYNESFFYLMICPPMTVISSPSRSYC